MVIGLDCDGVLSDLMPHWLSLYNAEWGDSLRAQECTVWETHTIVKPECGVRIYDYLRKPQFWRTVPLIAGAMEGVARLSSMGHELVVVTDTPAEGVKDRLDWLREHFPSIPKANYVITRRKDLVRLDLLIEDSPHHIRAAKCPAVIFDQPYNQDVPGSRVRSWTELLDYVERLEQDIRRPA